MLNFDWLLKTRSFIAVMIMITAASYAYFSKSPTETNLKPNEVTFSLSSRKIAAESPIKVASLNSKLEAESTTITDKPIKLFVVAEAGEPAEKQTVLKRVDEIPSKNEPVTQAHQPSFNKKPEVFIEAPRGAIDRDFWLWLGYGMNYVSVSQSLGDFSSGLGFSAQKVGSQNVRAGFFLSPRYGVDFGYKQTPGEVKGSNTITVTGGNYHWTSMNTEILYRGGPNIDDRSRSIFRLGLQSHGHTFLVPTGGANIDVQEALLLTASLGVDYHYQFRDLRIEWQLRYQYPLKSSVAGASLELDSHTGFDGSLGAVHPLANNWSVGIYWYGQYHDYDFNFSNSEYKYSGDMSLFYSTVDLRIGMEF